MRQIGRVAALIRVATAMCALSWISHPAPPPGQNDGEPGPGSQPLVASFTADPLVIDGVMDEAAWKTAMIATDFVQTEPREHDPATERTEVLMLLRSRESVIGAFLHDSARAASSSGDLR